METIIHLDWLQFSCDSEPSGDDKAFLSLFLEQNLGPCREGTGNRFYRRSWHWEGLVVWFQNRIESNRYFQFEFTGKFFQSREREEWAWDLMKTLKGRPSRIDVAWDYELDGIFDERFVHDMKKIQPRFSSRRDFEVDGVWSGFTVGYGKGSEVSLRFYDKALEQKRQEEFPGGWWRLEMTLRGNTLKDQGWDNVPSLDSVYGMFRAGMLKRYGFLPDDGVVGVCEPRKKGIAGVQGQVVYWNRKAEKAKTKLESLARDIQPLEEEKHGQILSGRCSERFGPGW